MALLGHGGKSSVEIKSLANTRPSHSARDSTSSSRIGAAAAMSSKRCRAASTGIRAPVLPGLSTGFTRFCLLQMRDEIARAVTVIQLLGEDAVPTGAHGIGGAWQAAHQGAVGQPRQGARLYGGGADIGHGYLAEQLAKTIDLLVEQAAHCFRGTVATGEAGAAGNQHHLHHVFSDPV